MSVPSSILPFISRPDGRWKVGSLDGWVYDIEVFPNFFCVQFFDGVDSKTFDHTQFPDLVRFVTDTAKVLIGFNNSSYDDVVLRAICQNPTRITTNEIYELSGLLIAKRETLAEPQIKERNLLIYAYGRNPWAFSVDLHQVTNRKAGLKEYECRMGLPTVAESPAAFDQPVTEVQIPEILRYNLVDVNATSYLLEKNTELVELRHTLSEQYALGTRIYSMGDAKIAEHFVLTALERKTGTEPRTLRNLAQNSPNNRAKQFPVAGLLPYSVNFTTPVFQQLFETLKAGSIQRQSNGALELDTELPGNQAVVNGLTLNFGRGGLHSDDEPGVFTSDDMAEIWDVDVTSYYPGMMIAYGIRPHHVLPAFTDELRKLRDQRVAAKKAGDKITSEALKIVINSVFGKLGDLYSPLRDDYACMQVTIGGQILLLLLIEAVQVAGATVLSANTDGLLLRVPVDKAAAIYAALRSWETTTSLALEEKAYKTVARRDVNNYIAIASEPDKKGNLDIKSKGCFNADATKLSGRIVPLAVQEHLRTSLPIETIIANHGNAADFLYYQRSQSDGHFERAGQQLPRTVRWYASADEAAPIERVSPTGARATIPNAHRTAIAIELPSGFTRADLPGLDVQHYVTQSQKLLNGALAGPLVERGTTQARRLQEMGLILLPQRGGMNPKGITLDDLDTIRSLANRRCETWGIITGPNTQTLVLDLDKIEVLNPTLIEILSAHPTLTTWHGEGSADAVRAGRKRGAVCFHYAGQDARIYTRRTKPWLNKHGFEVAFGAKIQTVIGQHRDVGDNYVQDGEVADAPEALIEFIGLRSGLPKKRRQDEAHTDAGDLDRLRLAADAVFGNGWARPFNARDGLSGVEGTVPGYERRSTLRLWVSAGRVSGFTFHANFDTRSRVQMIQEAYDRLLPPGGGPGGGGTSTAGDEHHGPAAGDDPAHLDASDAPAMPSEEDRREATNCADAFGQITSVGVVIGATGTGKSWQAVTRAIERHEQDLFTLLVAPDKEGIEQMRKYLLKQWIDAGRVPAELCMEILVSARLPSDTEDDGSDATGASGGEIKTSTRIVITHHHFASRKPLTRFLYSALTWVREHLAEVILDEADLYIERQNHHLQLDNRYMLIGGAKGQWTRVNHCPSAKGQFRCKTCHLRSGGRVTNLGTHMAYRAAATIVPSQFSQPLDEEFTITSENLSIEQTINLPTLNLRLSSLAQTPKYLTQRDFSQQRKPPKPGEEQPTPQQEMLGYLRDLIDCSYQPTLAEPKLVDADMQIVEADPHVTASADAADADAAATPVFDSAHSASYHFPWFVCNARFLLLYDRAAVFFLMRHASRLILMSATIDEQHMAFLRSCANGRSITEVRIATTNYQPLDQVVLIGHQGRIAWMDPLGERAAAAIGCNYSDVGVSNRTTIERLGNALAAAGRPPLMFMPTKEDALAVFARMKEKGWTFYIEGEYRMHIGQAVAESQTTDGSLGLLSYSRSALGTGMNLPQYMVAVVDGTVRRPHYVFNPALKTEDAYLEAQEMDRVHIMVQNVGRILRGTGVKFVFVVGISPGQLAKLAKEVERLAQAPTASWFTPDDTVTAMATLVASVKAGQLVVPDVPKPEPKTRNRQSRKQRAAADATSDPVERLQAAIAKVQERAKDGATWRGAARAANVARLPKAEQDQVRAAFEAAITTGGVTNTEGPQAAEDDVRDDADSVWT